MIQDSNHRQYTGREIILRGGPKGLPEEARRLVVDHAESKIKLHFGAGYEHFEQVDGAAETGPIPFQWTMRTKIAE
ncbi:hypothetical protein GCM10023322_84080 [Rugosimonospora acidiphila]|uniref:Uncharacterized protein n=1 Tax=Rugosimonospora acidiphila TaxID=556531 RepID=A0ABP9SX04_9ACTN